MLTWLLKMHIDTIIDDIWQTHGRWQGLSYGQLALLFVAYVIHQRSHRLMNMEGWLQDHRTIIEQVTEWLIGEKDGTDDRLGLLLDALGNDEEKGVILQQRIGEHLLHAYEAIGWLAYPCQQRIFTTDGPHRVCALLSR